MPGEISLAHNGVLFLDELPEFQRQALEVLRQPIEDNRVTISRASSRVTYPCSMMFVAAMNPCPCGYRGHPKIACTCSETAVQRYISRVSGPLLDRIDLHVEVAPVEFADLTGENREEELGHRPRPGGGRAAYPAAALCRGGDLLQRAHPGGQAAAILPAGKAGAGLSAHLV